MEKSSLARDSKVIHARGLLGTLRCESHFIASKRVLALTGLSSLLSVCAFQSALQRERQMKSALRTPQSAVQREAELRAKEGEIGLAGWLKRYRFLSAQGQGSERTVLKWLIFPASRCPFARARRTARSSPGSSRATFCSPGSSACYSRYEIKLEPNHITCVIGYPSPIVYFLYGGISPMWPLNGNFRN